MKEENKIPPLTVYTEENSTFLQLRLNFFPLKEKVVAGPLGTHFFLLRQQDAFTLL